MSHNRAGLSIGVQADRLAKRSRVVHVSSRINQDAVNKANVQDGFSAQFQIHCAFLGLEVVEGVTHTPCRAWFCLIQNASHHICAASQRVIKQMGIPLGHPGRVVIQ